MMISSKTHQYQELVSNTNNNVVPYSAFLPYVITQTPFLFSPPSFVSHQVISKL